jgi:HNH endonuclease
MKEYAPPQYRTAAHIIPHSIGYSNAGYLFGEPSQGAELIWSMCNGLIMDSNLEKSFDKGDFVLVPIPTERGEPSRWRFILMNEKLRKYKKVGDLDGIELEFKNNNCPAHRFLYYHFVSTLLRYVRYEKPGWAEKRVNLPTGKIWATPGPYLRRSMLKVLANVIGDCEPSEEVFGDGVFDGAGSKPPQEEKLIAQEILVDREQRVEDEEFELPVDM